VDESFREVLKYFELPHRSPEYIQKWVLMVLLMIGLLTVLYFIGKLMQRSRDRLRISKASNARELSDEERELILRAVRGRNRIIPELMLGSLSEFHRLFGPWMHDLISKAPKDREARNTLDNIFVLRKKLFGDVVYHFGSITSTVQLKIGQKVNLTFNYRGKDLTVSSVVLDVDGAAITCTNPRDGAEYLTFVQGHPFRVSFYRENDGYYQFDTYSLRQTETARAQFLLLAHALRIERIQSREFYREPAKIPFNYRRYAWDNRPETRYLSEELATPESMEGLVLNIGGGGILFSSRDNLRRNDLIAFDLPLGQDAVIPDILGKVVRAEPVPEEPERMLVHLQFLNIKPSEQDLIVRMIQRHKVDKRESES
jgi:c-di-GMP-binding flagellar brake protein YcgR